MPPLRFFLLLISSSFLPACVRARSEDGARIFPVGSAAHQLGRGTCDGCALGDDHDVCPAGSMHVGKVKACLPCGCDDQDTDGDGICDKEDACPHTPSTQAANTNAVSELVHAPAMTWPDVCDPVAAPAAVPAPVEIPLPNPICNHPELCSIRKGTDNSHLNVTPIRSNRAPGLPGSPAFVSELNVATTSRFCQNPLLATDPHCGDNFAIQDARLTDAATADTEKRSQPYHRIRIDRGSVALPRGASTPFDYVNAHSFDTLTQYQVQWQHLEDFAFWQTKAGTLNEIIPLPSPDPQFPEGSAASGLSGKMWLHADSKVGDTLDVGTGVHGEQLANTHLDLSPEHYYFGLGPGPKSHPPFMLIRWPIEIDPSKPTWQPFPDQPPGQTRVVFWGGAALGGPFVLTTGGDVLDIAARVGPGLLSSLTSSPVVLNAVEPFSGWWSTNERAAVLLSADATQVVDSVALSPDGRLVGGADDRRVGCTAGQVLVRCGRTLRCAVPCNGIVGDDPTAPGTSDPTCTLAARPASDGLTDESAFTCQSLDAGPCPAGTMACSSSCFVPCDGSVGCVPDGRFGDEQPDLCGDRSAGATLAVAGNPGVPAVPEPRTDFVGVYARSIDRIFVLGGKDASGTSLRDIWTGRPTGTFVRLPVSADLGEILAGTYHFVDRELYVLDKVPLKLGKKTTKPTGAQLVRLLRVSPFTGEVTPVTSWLSPGVVFDRFFVVQDRDGELLVAASSAVASRHVIVRLEIPAGDVEAVRMGAGQLVAPPFVDPSGYVAVTLDKKTGLLLPGRFSLTQKDAGSKTPIEQVFQ